MKSRKNIISIYKTNAVYHIKIDKLYFNDIIASNLKALILPSNMPLNKGDIIILESYSDNLNTWLRVNISVVITSRINLSYRLRIKRSLICFNLNTRIEYFDNARVITKL